MKSDGNGSASPISRSKLSSIATAIALAAGIAGCGSYSTAVTAPGGSWRTPVEILVFFLLFLFIFRFMRGTRGEGILKGIATILLAGFFVLFYLSRALDLPRVGLLLREVLNTSVIALIIIF